MRKNTDEMVPCACGCGLFRRRFINHKEHRYIRHHQPPRRRPHIEIRTARGQRIEADPRNMEAALKAANKAPLRRFPQGYATDPAGPFYQLLEVATLIQTGALRPKKLPRKYGRAGMSWIAAND